MVMCVLQRMLGLAAETAALVMAVAVMLAVMWPFVPLVGP